MLLKQKMYITAIDNEPEYKNTSNEVLNSSELNVRAVVVDVGVTTVYPC